jgi:SAM-dependent methyltransferase
MTSALKDSLPSPSDTLAQRAENWSRHWRSGVHDSCTGSFKDANTGAYGGAIAAFWKAVFGGLAAGSRVLDVATGNGALPRLLLDARPQRDWSCDAVDLAVPAPHWTRDVPGPQELPLRFHAGIQAEQLPFAERQFQLVVSQFGIEYSDLTRSMPELLRVLAPGGEVALVLHHAQARPVSLAEVEIAHLDWLLAPQGLVGCTADLLEPLSRVATAEGRASLANDPGADAARERFNAAQDALSLRARAVDGADVLFEAQQGVARIVQLALSGGLAAAREALTALSGQLADVRWRLVDLRRHALDQTQLDTLAQTLQLAHPQAALTCWPLQERGHLMGWALRLQGGASPAVSAAHP